MHQICRRHLIAVTTIRLAEGSLSMEGIRFRMNTHCLQRRYGTFLFFSQLFAGVFALLARDRGMHDLRDVHFRPQLPYPRVSLEWSQVTRSIGAASTRMLGQPLIHAYRFILRGVVSDNEEQARVQGPAAVFFVVLVLGYRHRLSHDRRLDAVLPSVVDMFFDDTVEHLHDLALVLL